HSINKKIALAGLFLSPSTKTKSSIFILSKINQNFILRFFRFVYPYLNPSISEEIAQDLSPLIIVYKDGQVKRLTGTDIIPPSLDMKTSVQSTDVFICSETGLSARLYIPSSAINTSQKLPLLIYFHGGGFVAETPFCATYHNYVNSLVAVANIVVVSVNYRLAPEDPIPAAYDDSWTAVKWVSSHSQGKGPSEWVNSNADFARVFFAGDSAGANIANNMAIRIGLLSDDDEEVVSIKLNGIVMVHPYFCGKDFIGNEPNNPAEKAWHDAVWHLACPSSSSGSDDPLINPAKDPNLGKVGCGRVLVCIAEKDGLRDRGLYYSELLGKKSGWKGVLEVMEAKGEGHVFHLRNPTCENAVLMLHKISTFISH
ncbi:probable carboxylesterase 13, partial [Ziziphus jujuba]|uniref:Probable carboxylesterase 13 n=1 Tax=Ziziphus jujuba TaxID=326968 RepID=A0ABM3IWR0_ZIZJJ